jgi:ribose/xylose/arabinose/galactoside ABC-type transport system permease subunit
MPPQRVRLFVAARCTAQPAGPPQLREALAQANQPGDVVDQLVVGVLPVEPGHLVVLAVGVVVAALRAAEFVATLQHRYALRDEQRGQQRTLQAAAFFEHRRIVAFTFLAAVPRQIVAVPVAVFLAVELVVFFLVTDQIAQGEAVVRGEEVDAGLRCAAGYS